MEQNHITTFTPIHLEVPPPYDTKQDTSTECTVHSAPSTASSLPKDGTVPAAFKPIVIPHKQSLNTNC
jgi:hypothetical protein